MTAASIPIAKTLDSVQALRGLAAIFVLLFHMTAVQKQVITAIPNASDINSSILDFYGLFSKGYIGVDLFFILSGFIMVYITIDRPSGLKSVIKFAGSRLMRIYPLWIILCLFLISFYLLTTGIPVGDHNIAKPDRADYLLKSLFLIPQSSHPIIGQGWTLVHEMYFYSGVAVLLFVPAKKRFIGVLVWVLLTLYLAMAGFALPVANSYLSIAGSLMTFEFFAGMLIGWLVVRQYIIFPKVIAVLGIFILILALATYTAPWSELMQYGRVAVYTLPLAAIIYGFAGHEIKYGLSVPRWLSLAGDWSYSLYLSHTFILLIIARLFPLIASYLPQPLKGLFDLGNAGIIDNLAFFIAGIVGCFLGAAFLFYTIERPFIRLLRKQNRP